MTERYDTTDLVIKMTENGRDPTLSRAEPSREIADSGPVDPESMTFEELLGMLEGVIRQMGSSDIGIENVADLYERAEQLHALASARLAKVQARIERITAGGDRA
jgi:exodeoxyribonuclease VII small subunit